MCDREWGNPYHTEYFDKLHLLGLGLFFPLPKLTSTDCNLFPCFMSPFYSAGVLAIWDCGPSILHFREWFWLKSSVLSEILAFLALSWKNDHLPTLYSIYLFLTHGNSTCIVQTVDSARLQKKSEQKTTESLVTAVSVRGV